MSGVAPLPRISSPHAEAESGPRRLHFVEVRLNIPAEIMHYGMYKTAQLAVSRGIAGASPGTGVTVNTVLPGPTRTGAWSGSRPDAPRIAA